MLLRQQRCLVGLGLGLAVLACCAGPARSDFTARINKISDDLDKALDDVLQLDGPNYTDLHAKRRSQQRNGTAPFDPSGMSSLYNITERFMELLVSKKAHLNNVIEVKDGRIELVPPDYSWKPLVTIYGAAAALIVALLFFALLMPVCGLCFCCSRCCCKQRSKPFDKRGDLCRKICFAALLIAMGTLLLFGVVCTFVSNQHMESGVSELPSSANYSLDTVDYFIESTSDEVNILFNVNYHEFETLLFSILDKCSNIVLDQLREYSKATALTQVVKIVNGLEDIKGNLQFMKNATNDLRTNASQLNDGLRKAKGELLQILNDCSRLNECNELSDKYINQLGTDIDFNNLPDISKEIDQLTQVLDSDITGTVREGQEAFNNIRVEINRTISSQIPRVKDSVRKAGSEITGAGKSINDELGSASNINADLKQHVKFVLKYVKEYSPYRYYVGLGVGSVLLIITVCITFGLMCGVCGKRPDAYSDDCCNKGAGSRFLMLGVAVIFLFATVLALIALVHFVVGISAQRSVCDPLRDPENNPILRLGEQLVSMQRFGGINLTISSLLIACHHNLSLYHVLNLKDKQNRDVDAYLEKFEINKTLNDLTRQINANTSVVILSSEARDHLEELVKSGIAEISYDKFIDELARNLTSVDLAFLATKLDELTEIIKEKVVDGQEVYSRLRVCAVNLRAYQKAYVQPMTATSRELITVAQNLKESLKFNKPSFKHAIHDLIDELEAAQKYLQLNGSATMVKIAYNFGRGIEKQVHNYLSRAIDKTKMDVGRCGPLSSAINSTMITACDKILTPWNGFWFSILWSLVLFIPITIIADKLSMLYQKLEPYPGPLVEAEYLYDAYADRDNVPLSHESVSRPKKKYKKKPKGYDGRGAYTAECNEIPGASHYQDTRYSDMAPKHWEEFPPGGLPAVYQRAPTEYERPPPYYFPDSERQQ